MYNEKLFAKAVHMGAGCLGSGTGSSHYAAHSHDMHDILPYHASAAGKRRLLRTLIGSHYAARSHDILRYHARAAGKRR